jgi:MYXO-CTERM domain-containing protein
MKRAHLFASILLLTVASLAQQPAGTPNQPDTTASPAQTYNQPSPAADQGTRPTEQNYPRPVETGHNWGGWGLLGLIGLGGLLGRRRDTTATTYRDERTYGQQQRRAG